MNALNGVVVPAVRQENRHPHQMAVDGANEAEAPSSCPAWLPERGGSGQWQERVLLE